MLKIKFVVVLFLVSFVAQAQPITRYIKKSYMIPVRDGVKLFTVVLIPRNANKPVPILIHRTPYGSDFPIQDDSTLATNRMGYIKDMAKEGYIFVFQDIRGKYKSEGKMVIHQPLIHVTQKSAIDESTDTWDVVDWLVRNIPGNNGKAGISGTSYPGWLALVGSVDPHPALKAASEEACMGDLFLGDDFHHNGAFRLSYGMEYTWSVEAEPATSSDFSFPQYDLFDWYLKLGPLKNIDEQYFHKKIPTWNNFTAHPNYDAFWKQNTPLSYMKYPQIPIVHVGGYFDQEDINGPQLMYEHLEKKDSAHRNYLLLGPWNHGQWAEAKADSLGKISFGGPTATQFHEFEKRWFDYWLKGIGDGKFREATCFQTGSNQWKTYDVWPPKSAVIKKLYAKENHACTFEKPTTTTGKVTYDSDPAKPVPYRSRPIEATYGQGSRWDSWQVEDQRFVSTRPDVVNFSGERLEDDLTVTGKIIAHVFASTTASDADFIVKLIDLYPEVDGRSVSMSGFELPVAMEVFRGRFRKSFERPLPFTPNKVEEIVIDLHQINHTFLKGHHLMIQIQSTWFPLIDLNPQKYVPNIFEAVEADFVKATHTIYCNAQFSTFVELPVVSNR